ncbi:MAG: S-layer homology domain-containing protein [Burkholderiales bacterium]
MKQARFAKYLIPLLIAAGSAVAATDPTFDTNIGANKGFTYGIPADVPGGPQADGSYGTGSSDFWVSGSDFTPRTSGPGMSYGSFHYWYPPAGASSQYEAQFQLPNGANMSVLRCFFYDTDAGSDINVGMWRQYLDTTTNTPGVVNLATVSSSGSSGYQDSFATPTPGQFLSRSPVGTYNELNIYTLIPNMVPGNANLRLRGCRIFYNRTISPAPASATFTDVPVGSQFFAEVEALVRSGITAGTTATTYSPANNVTRLQMAAFFARALGLHWPPF